MPKYMDSISADRKRINAEQFGSIMAGSTCSRVYGSQPANLSRPWSEARKIIIGIATTIDEQNHSLDSD